MRGRIFFALGLLGGACGEAPRLSVRFPDELSAAPARFLDVLVFDEPPCPDLAAQRFDDLLDRARRRRRVPLPIPRDARPIGPRAGVIAVAARDAEDWVMARGCRRVDDAESEIRVELSLRPACDEPARALELALVLDTSRAMRSAEIALDGRLRAPLAAAMTDVSEVEGTRLFFVAARDPGPVVSEPDAFAPEDLATEELTGAPRIWDGLFEATRRLRHDARCGVEPAILAVAAGHDASSDRLPIDVRLGLEGAESDPADGIFGYGIGLETEGHAALFAAMASTESRVVGPLRSAAAFALQLSEAQTAFAARLDR